MHGHRRPECRKFYGRQAVRGLLLLPVCAIKELTAAFYAQSGFTGVL